MYFESGQPLVQTRYGCTVQTYLFIALRNPIIEVGNVANPVPDVANDAAAKAHPGQGAGVARLPCKVDDEGADCEDDDDDGDASGCQHSFDQPGAEPGGHGWTGFELVMSFEDGDGDGGGGPYSSQSVNGTENIRS